VAGAAPSSPTHMNIDTSLDEPRTRLQRLEPARPRSAMAAGSLLVDIRSDEPTGEEAFMRAIECPCGHRLQGADDEALFRLARDHVDSEHPEMARTDEQLRERIAADAQDCVPARAISAS
jgi:hypothetical protein